MATENSDKAQWSKGGPPPTPGWRWCHACSTVVDASVGHECEAPAITLASRVLTERVRAEFAEGLVNRVAFAHGCDLMGQYDQTDSDDAAARLANNGWAWPLCATDTCPFCDAARLPAEDPTIATELERLATGHG